MVAACKTNSLVTSKCGIAVCALQQIYRNVWPQDGCVILKGTETLILTVTYIACKINSRWRSHKNGGLDKSLPECTGAPPMPGKV